MKEANKLQNAGNKSKGEIINNFIKQKSKELEKKENLTPSYYVSELWSIWQKSEERNKSGKGEEENNQAKKLKDGRSFEAIIEGCLRGYGITPFFSQVELSLLPLARFDVIFWASAYEPICLSVKTSLRERYKQAALEGIILKQVYRRSKTYVLTLNEIEANTRNKEIEKDQVVGVDKYFCCTSADFDVFIYKLREKKYVVPPPLQQMKSSKEG